jgi:hypothetical protein
LKRKYENCEETPEENTGETIDGDNRDTSNMIAEDNSTSDDNNNERSHMALVISVFLEFSFFSCFSQGLCHPL